ncbi:MAG: alpha/beta hydrolase-fold protein [Thermomonas sp.]|uniref:alpha/beta hydrolase-fold protein n=1 Tax=Thermomonas sp. TaxID=1971895 RepID=UPI0039E367E6
MRLIVMLCLLLACALAQAQGIRIDTLEPAAPGLSDKPIRVRVYLPPGYDAAQARFDVLYVNDGQDMDAVGMQATLERLYARGVIRPVIVVAIDMPPDRMAGYGLFDRAKDEAISAPTKYGVVGSNAHLYAKWLTQTLVPEIDSRYRTVARADGRAVLGWSLGAASAFGIGWQYPELFGRIGAFSPSFWLSRETGSSDAVQSSRIAHALVEEHPPLARPKLFFAAGSLEETDDRDGDGIIDVLDDTRDLIEGWQDAQGAPHKGLRQLGYSANMDGARTPSHDAATLYLLQGGRHDQPSWARMLPAFLRWAYAVHAPALGQVTGSVESWQDVPSRHVAARNVDVWLPPSYAANPDRRYPVLYMHDGQNLFDPSLVSGHGDWDVDGAMTRLIAEGAVREAIVVGVWNTARRFEEYMPQVGEGEQIPTGVDWFPSVPRAALISDDYLRFIVEELKPFIDARYRTLPGREDTAVMGSSMGGLISLYALAKYPQVFGSAGAVSTHWPAGDGAMVDWLSGHLPKAGTHRIWFDHGTATLDAGYAPYQQRMDAAMHAAGWVQGRDWESRVYEGAAHDEQAWRARVDQTLRFLLGVPCD